MQLRLKVVGAALASAVAILSAAQTSRADDGTVSVRGAYYKERATRVTQPMVDAELEAGESGTVAAHFLVDSITSASVAAGATGDPFTETRYEFGGSYTHELGSLRLGGGGRVSYEPDYLSVTGSIKGEMDLAEKNATVGVALAQGRDDISNAGVQGGMAPEITGTLNTSMASVSLSQVLTPNVIASATYDLIYLSGYQENVYRAVPAGGSFVPERVPESRIRNAVYSSVRAYIEATKTAAIVGYRLYFDDWGIVGHTPEVRVIQEIATDVEVHGRYRFYKQSQAEFYKEIYDSADPDMQPFLTADQKLSNQRTQIFGAKLDGALSVIGVTGRFSAARISALFEYTTQTTSFGNAIAGQVAFAVPFAY